MPDLAPEIPGWPLLIQVDCKRIKKDSKDSRLGRAIQDTNAKIKQTGQHCHGLVYIDVSDRVTETNFGDDSLPKEIKDVKNFVQRQLAQHNTHVSGAAILWKDYIVVPMEHATDRALCFIRYRSQLVRHQNPKEPLPAAAERFMPGYTAMLSILLNQG